MGLTSWARTTTVVACALGALSPAIAAAATTAPAPPPTPANVAVVIGNASVHVGWTGASANTTFTARAAASGRATRTCKVTRADACTIFALANGVTYGVTVTAATPKGGTSAPSAVVTATVGTPGPPRAVLARAAKVLAVVKWTEPAETGVAATTRYTATAEPGGMACDTVSSLLTPAARTCTIVGLTKLTTYTMTVVAQNRFGASVSSKGVTVTTT